MHARAAEYAMNEGGTQMISALHLMWIVPLAAMVGLLAGALCAAARDDRARPPRPAKRVLTDRAKRNIMKR